MQYSLILSGICTLAFAAAPPASGMDPISDSQTQLEKEDGAPVEDEAHQITTPEDRTSVKIASESLSEASKQETFRLLLEGSRPQSMNPNHKTVPTLEEQKAVVKAIYDENFRQMIRSRQDFISHLENIQNLNEQYGLHIKEIDPLLKVAKNTSKSLRR